MKCFAERKGLPKPHVAIKNFVSKDEMRPALCHVKLFRDGEDERIVATNAHILLSCFNRRDGLIDFKLGPIPPGLNEWYVDPNGKHQPSDGSDFKYPDWKAVIPNHSKSISFDLNDVVWAGVSGQAFQSKTKEGVPFMGIIFPDEIITVNAGLFGNVVDMLLNLCDGVSREITLFYDTPNRAIVFRWDENPDNLLLLLPIYTEQETGVPLILNVANDKLASIKSMREYFLGSEPAPVQTIEEAEVVQPEPAEQVKEETPAAPVEEVTDGNSFPSVKDESDFDFLDDDFDFSNNQEETKEETDPCEGEYMPWEDDDDVEVIEEEESIEEESAIDSLLAELKSFRTAN